jgi:hypothetical protein
MSSPLPEEGTAKYYEAVADEPSDFIDDGPEEATAATKATKKDADVKVAKKAAEVKEKNFLDAIAQKAVVDAAQKEIDDIQAGMNPDQKARMLTAYGVIDDAKAATTSAKKRAPKGLYKTQCDDVLKKIETTIKYIEDKHKDEHRELYLLGLYVKEFESRVPFDRAEHDAFKNWLTDNKVSIGLTKQTRKSVTPASTPAGSKNVSRAASVALNTSFENDEEAGAGTGSD